MLLVDDVETITAITLTPPTVGRYFAQFWKNKLSADGNKNITTVIIFFLFAHSFEVLVIGLASADCRLTSYEK